MLYWAGNDVSSGVHGFYVDNIEVRALGEMGRGSDNLRVLYWNIQNGSCGPARRTITTTSSRG